MNADELIRQLHEARQAEAEARKARDAQKENHRLLRVIRNLVSDWPDDAESTPALWLAKQYVEGMDDAD